MRAMGSPPPAQANTEDLSNSSSITYKRKNKVNATMEEDKTKTPTLPIMEKTTGCNSK